MGVRCGKTGKFGDWNRFLSSVSSVQFKLACESTQFVRYDYIYWNIFGLIHGIYEGPVIRRLQV